MKNICTALIFAMMLILIGCNTPIRIQASNHDNSNLNNRNDNVPITLVIYQLKDVNKFEYASIQDLTMRESVVLGRDNVDSIRIQVPPNEKDMLVAEFAKKEGKYIGILALFANSQGKKQKFYKKLNKVFKNTIKIDITQEGITNSKNNRGTNNKEKR
ncbi:type VI secretion lipoprotein [Helicobacter bilis]|uniref:Type VI secretion lipoprotein n=2 Tax=Helicobacter bilis TaxID=37372 RepID=C3XIK7_9HELI|nr:MULTISPECIES: type VI secretion system lipoprotein TssJ [Helicobacter]AQQ59255.1 type VI secretion lipoprotein [Helicobacter bilis]EEO24846.1 type VI secretion lipoprotein [Helicobacter bilis ATCC 43879]